MEWKPMEAWNAQKESWRMDSSNQSHETPGETEEGGLFKQNGEVGGLRPSVLPFVT